MTMRANLIMSSKLYNKAKWLIIFLFFAITSTAFAVVYEGGEGLPKFVPGEVLVKFKDRIVLMEDEGFETASISSIIKSPSILAISEKYGVKKIIRVFDNVPEGESTIILKSGERRILPDLSRTFKFVMPEYTDVMEAVNDFRSDTSVEYAEPNYLRKVAATPDDTRYFEQWGLEKIGLTSLETGTSGWNESTGESSVAIAVIDTGVDWQHEDLEDNLWINSPEDYNHNGRFDNSSTFEGGDLNGIDDDLNGYIDDVAGWNFVSYTGPDIDPSENPGPNNNPIDVHGHGTHVSGIASAVTDNAKGIAGVGWHCKIMAVKAGFKTKSGEGVLQDSDSAAAIVYAASMDAKAINMSWGSYEDSGTISDAIDYAYASDVTLVAAAGNFGTDIPNYPAAYPKVFAIGATARNDTRSSWIFSSSNYGDWVDVSAPGGSGLTKGNNWILSTVPGNDYDYNTGTSMASPFVAGLASLIKAKFPSWSNEEIMNQIRYTVDYTKFVGFTIELSKRVNAYNALRFPQAGITSPGFNSQVLKQPLVITGVATDAIQSDFDHYVLEYKPYGGSWTLISSEANPKFNETLGVWDISESEALGQHDLRLRVMDASGNTSEAISLVTVVLPGGVKFIDSYPAPNPFNPYKERTYITFTLSKPATNVTVFIYDITGRSIYRKKYFYLDAGFIKLPQEGWDGRDVLGKIVSNGVYIYQISLDGKVATKGKIIVIK